MVLIFTCPSIKDEMQSFFTHFLEISSAKVKIFMIYYNGRTVIVQHAKCKKKEGRQDVWLCDGPERRTESEGLLHI